MQNLAPVNRFRQSMMESDICVGVVFMVAAGGPPGALSAGPKNPFYKGSLESPKLFIAPSARLQGRRSFVPAVPVGDLGKGIRHL